ncbi:hypothetical protein FQA39_LY16198 [Lamprigera yunnana]|nr:hypothetical protein FQA39_LY16198 [Lamprigera yunnana]
MLDISTSTMVLLKGVLFLLQIISSPTLQCSYEIKQSRIETEYYNPNYATTESNVYKYNRSTIALNVTFVVHIEILETDLVVIKGYKWMSNEYRLDILQFQFPIKHSIGFKYFDVVRMLRNCTHPPLTWPIKKEVLYNIRDYVPDCSQIPPGIPQENGNWDSLLQGQIKRY